MTSQLFIENYEVDINSDLASLVTFAIDDIKNFASRQTAFSKTIILPGSAKNNKLLGNIFEVGSANSYDPALPNVGINFNASASANCIYFQDNIQAFKGSLRILQINLYRGKIEYEVAIAGDLSTLNVRLSSGFLEDLDFSGYNHTYDETNIAASWDNPGGSGYYYPLADYGTYSTNKHDWDFRTFRPALYVKEYIDKIFTAASFRYSSDFLDSAFFKTLIVPHNQKTLTSITTQLFSALRSGGGNVIDSGTLFIDIPLAFDSMTGTAFSASLGNTRFTYVLADPQTIHITATSTGTYVGQTTFFTIEVQVNGVTVPGTVTTYPVTGSTSPQFYSYTASFDYAIANGDYIEVMFNSPAIVNGDRITATTAGLGATSLIPSVVEVGYGDVIDMNFCIPKNIKQVDFLNSLCKMFNLYITEDKFDNRLLYIEPYIYFYSEESQNAVDWTYKLDRSQNIAITPMSEINAKIYNFNFAKDSDYYNDQYQKRFNQTYGSYLYDTQFEFVQQTTNVEVIFAPTPLVGYSGEDKVYPTIFKLNGTTEERVDSVIRIMQSKKITGVTSWDLLDGVTVLASYSKYGYAGHFDDPDAITTDINFGTLEELFFVVVTGDLSANLFNVFWSAYMAEITDKDSKLLTGKFYLTPKDIQDLDFSKYVNVDGNLFRINKIGDYNMTKPDLCNCELLKVINTLY